MKSNRRAFVKTLAAAGISATVLPDAGERYLSSILFEGIPA